MQAPLGERMGTKRSPCQSQVQAPCPQVAGGQVVVCMEHQDRVRHARQPGARGSLLKLHEEGARPVVLAAGKAGVLGRGAMDDRHSQRRSTISRFRCPVRVAGAVADWLTPSAAEIFFPPSPSSLSA